MCGIAGILSLDGSAPDLAGAERMLGKLIHRGPDDCRTWSDDRLALAHTRLSIIDLAQSVQPMLDADDESILCFNGEILNYADLRSKLSYPFATSGDTEAILAAHREWGDGAPARFRGQFAYAHYWTRTGELSLVRDFPGILPLYWWSDGRRLVFASEIVALLAGMGFTPPLDELALGEYLTARFVSAPRTLLAGIRKVRPGHVLRVLPDGSIREHPFERAPDEPVPEVHRSPRAALAEFDGLITQAVERALVADVPVGTYLSGGVDSSLLTAKVANAVAGQPVHTFCAGFADSPNDESKHALAVAEHLGTDHVTVNVRSADFAEHWTRLSTARGAPMAEPADVAVYMLALKARESVKVVLSGEGSDELFAGYPKYRFAQATRWVGALPVAVRSEVLGRVEGRLPASETRARVAIRALSQGTYGDRLSGWFASFGPDDVASFGLQSSADDDIDLHGSPLRAMLERDMKGWLSDNLLERGDRMSMAASVEMRPPFLDRDVVEFARSLPPSLLVHNGVGKWLVKEAARRHVPASVIDRPKVGFRVPLDLWFRGGLRSIAYEQLMAADSLALTYLPRDYLERMLQEHHEGKRDHSVKIWTLTSLETWHHELARVS